MIKKGAKREAALSKETYFSDLYFGKIQLFSLSEQIHLLYKYSKNFEQPKILEVGKGNGFVSDFFKKSGYDMTTLDINPQLEPDIVGNVLELSGLMKSKANVILCSEVLEHMEFKYFQDTLEQLRLVSSEYVIITLPRFKKFFGVNIQFRLPKIKAFSLPLFLKVRANKTLGTGHFWEIDYDAQTSKSSIETILQNNFDIVEKGYFPTNPYHCYYVLKVK